jgi:TrmH family RNA methyltransferase
VQLSENGIIIIGNESKGISDRISKYINYPICIPSYLTDNHSPQAESLNASVATGIICAEFRRR